MVELTAESTKYTARRRMQVPTVAAAFIADHIRSPEELQLLLTAMHADDRWWDAPAVAHELGISPAKARRALDHLASQRNRCFDIRDRPADVPLQVITSPGTDPSLT